MAASYEDCARINRISQETGIPCFVAYYRRYLPYFQKVRQMVEDGEIGNVINIQIRFAQPPRDLDYNSTNLPWRVQPDICLLYTSTIDLKDTLFKSIQDTLGNKVLNNSQIAVAPTSGVTATPISNTTTIITATPVTPPAQPAIIGGSEGNTEIKVANNVTPSKEQSIDDQIKASSRMTITAGNDEQFEIGKECWGGFGQLFGKEVAFCIIDQSKSMGNMLMDQSDNYKISFYKQGSSEPWLIVNCKKLMKQTVTGEEAKKMNPSNNGQKAYNMYVGEVIK